MRAIFVAVGVLLAVAGWGATVTVPAGDAAALVAAVEKSQPGDEIRLAAGTYRLPETLALHTGTKLTGAGREQTILQPGGEKARVLLGLNGVQDVTVSDLALDGAPDPLTSRGLAAYNSQRLTLTRLAIRNLSAPGAIGIHFNGKAPTRENGVLDCLIADCVIENIAPANPWGAGVRCSWGSSRNTIRNCRIDNTGRGGIFGDNGSNDLVIRDNTVTRSHGEKLGIEVWGGCNRCVIEDNTIDHWLSIGGCDWCAVRRNKVACAEKDCSGFIGIEAIGSYLIFTDNAVDQGQIIGLSVSNNYRKEYHYYRGDSYRRCSQWAVQIQGEGPPARCYYFQDCTFADTSTAGGRVIYPGDEGNGFRWSYGSARDLTFEGCTMSGNARHGIQITTRGTDRLTFLGCRIENNKGAAIAHGGGFTGLEWRDCQVRGNASNELPPGVAMSAAPTAGLTGPASARVGQTVQFRSTASAQAGEIQKIMWDLGEGTPLTGRTVRHAFSRPGTYRVTQIVWDTTGRASRAEQVVEVK